MNPLAAWRALGLAGKLAVAIVVLLIVVAALWWANGGARREAAQADANATMSEARGKSATEASTILDKARDDAAASQDLSRENADAIRNAKGADQALDPALNDAGRRSLCQRQAYRRTAECVQLLGRPEP